MPPASGPIAATATAQRYRIGTASRPTPSWRAAPIGQYVIVMPSQRLVVARFGSAFTPRNDLDVVARLVADVIAALPPS